jgi:hypothetical protein
MRDGERRKKRGRVHERSIFCVKMTTFMTTMNESQNLNVFG